MDPRQDCEVGLDEHGEIRSGQRGLPFHDVQRLVREGRWRAIGGGVFAVRYGKWNVRVKVGRCILHVETVFRVR